MNLVCHSPLFLSHRFFGAPDNNTRAAARLDTCSSLDGCHCFKQSQNYKLTMTMKPSEKESSDDPTTTAKRSKPPPPTLSKRQRHAAGPNPSNTWQQQPQIKSAGARARAYIAYAGLADDDDDDDVGDDGENGDNSNVVAGEQLTSHSSSTKKKKSSRANSAAAKLLLDPQIDLNSPEVKFGRMLGGNDQRKRHEAVKMLRSYLTSRADFTKGGVGFSQLDFLKLWKVRRLYIRSKIHQSI